VAVTAPKSYFGHPGAGCGAIDMMVGIMILKHRLVPPTLNYRVPDPLCPVCVVHGRPQPLKQSAVMILSHSQHGQAVAVVLGVA
jgi:3-oxoacyl-(acyl-carrier-protein) synthase